jgi:hypothetical protein
MCPPKRSEPLVAELEEPVQHLLILGINRGLEHGQPDLDFSGLPLDVGQSPGSQRSLRRRQSCVGSSSAAMSDDSPRVQVRTAPAPTADGRPATRIESPTQR